MSGVGRPVDRWPGGHEGPRPRFEPAARLSGHHREQHVDGGLVLRPCAHLLRTIFVRCSVRLRCRDLYSGTEAAHLEHARDQRDEGNVFADDFVETQAVLGCFSLLRRFGSKHPKRPLCHAVTVLSLRTVVLPGGIVDALVVVRHRRHGVHQLGLGNPDEVPCQLLHATDAGLSRVAFLMFRGVQEKDHRRRSRKYTSPSHIPATHIECLCSQCCGLKPRQRSKASLGPMASMNSS